MLRGFETLLYNLDIVRQTFAQPGRRHSDKSSALPKLPDISRAAITHSGAEPANQLMKNLGCCSAIRNHRLHPFGHIINHRRIILRPTLARVPIHIGAERSHPAGNFIFSSISD